MNRSLATLLLIVLGAWALATTGCNIAGPVFFAVHGPGNVDAEFELDPDRPTVLFIDDPASRIAHRRYRTIIGETAQETILAKVLLTEGNLFDTRSAMAAAGRGTASEPLTIQQIGEMVGAEVVIYAKVDRFGLDSTRSPAVPSSQLAVKVFDVPSGQRLWPPQYEGYPLRLNMPATPDNVAQSRSDQARIDESLAAFTGGGLAELFFTVEVTQSLRALGR